MLANDASIFDLFFYWYFLFFVCSTNNSHLARVARMPVERYASEYNMKHNRRGFAIIFNHEFFEIMSLKPRTGTNVDCENLRNTLQRLEFDVYVHKDFTFGKIQQTIEECKCAGPAMTLTDIPCSMLNHISVY